MNINNRVQEYLVTPAEKRILDAMPDGWPTIDAITQATGATQQQIQDLHSCGILLVSKSGNHYYQRAFARYTVIETYTQNAS